MVSESQQWINLGAILVLFATVSTTFLRKKSGPKWHQIGFDVVVFIVSMGALYCVFRYAIPFLDEHNALSNSYLLDYLGTVLGVLILGLFAHGFKNKAPALYGQIEVLLGLASAICVVESKGFRSSIPLFCVALLGAFYVVVRGFGSWSEDPKLKVAQSKQKSIFGYVKLFIFEENHPDDSSISSSLNDHVEKDRPSET